MYDINILKPILIEAINSSKSMREAGSKVNINFKTFCKYAKMFGVFRPNVSGKGISKKRSSIDLDEILKGNHPGYHTFKLKNRLLKENYKSHQCEICNKTLWNDLPIPLELDHIDGNPYNHKIDNIRLICPNCHAQTSTYRSKNRKTLKNK